MPTLKITGVDEVMARFVDERAQSLHFKGQAEYLRNLVREDMAKAYEERRRRLADIVAPLHAHSKAQGYTDECLAEIIDQARHEVAELRRDPHRP